MNTAELESADVDLGTFAGEQFTVARIKRSIFEQSTVGAIYTRRSTGADPTDPTARAPKDQHTVGADLYYATPRLFGSKNFDFQAFAAWNSNPDRGVDRSTSDLSSRGIRINYPNDIWSGRISYREFGDDYDPAVGFVTRSGFRSVELQISWAPRPNIDWIRRFNFSGQFRHLEGITTGITELRLWEFTLFGVDFEGQDNFNIGLERQFEYLDNSFEISDGILIGVGNYTNWEWTLMASTASRRVVSGRVQFRRGGLLERGSDSGRGRPGLSPFGRDPPICRSRDQQRRSAPGLVRREPPQGGRRVEHHSPCQYHGQYPIRRRLRDRGPLYANALDPDARQRSLPRPYAELAEPS